MERYETSGFRERRPASRRGKTRRIVLGTCAGLVATLSAASARGPDPVFRSLAEKEARIRGVRFRDATSMRVELYPLARLRRLTDGQEAFQSAARFQQAHSDQPGQHWLTTVTVDNVSDSVLEVAEGRASGASDSPANPMHLIRRLRSPRLLEVLLAMPDTPDTGRRAYHQELLRDWPPRAGIMGALYHDRIGKFLLTNGGSPRWEIPADGRHPTAIVAFDHPAGLKGTRWRFWLDRNVGYRPVRWDILDSRGRLGWQHTISYRPCGADTWFFDQYRWRSFYLGPHGERALRYTETHRALDLHLNPAVARTQFKMGAPPGTTVVDQRFGLSYQQGPREYSDQELIHLKRDPDVPLSAPSEPPTQRSGSNMLPACGLTALGITLLYASGRHRRRASRAASEPVLPWGAGSD